MQSEILNPERRRYIRLDTVFPVQFRLVSLDGKRFLSDWLMGFTRDVSKGGICLSVNAIEPKHIQLIRDKQAKISLEIEMPLLKSPVAARSDIAWIRNLPENPSRYIIGLSYEDIDPRQDRLIMRYAWTRKLFVPAVAAIFVLLGLGVAVNSFTNARLSKSNKALIKQLVQISKKANLAKEKADSIAREREELKSQSELLQSRIQNAQEEESALQEGLTKESDAKLAELSGLVDKLSKEKLSLEERLTRLKEQESAVSDELAQLDREKGYLAKENFDKMCQWLITHQNPRTGLVMSFEGDSQFKDFAFTYDQALAMMVYSRFSELDNARKTLDFFINDAQRSDNLFYNAYYSNDGTPAEYTVHSGPNIWIGMAVLHYTKRSQDTRYMGLAEEIARAIIALQDEEGGIRGGPQAGWYSTEHNLDAYAFFNMLFQLTSNQDFCRARDKVLVWLKKHTYADYDIPVKRGKGDSTIATDTYAWSIAAIGPQKLKEMGMDPDRIMDFAEKSCAAQVTYVRPDGQEVDVRGFDFAPQANLARGAIVSSEWTAQMVMAFRIMAGYYERLGSKVKALKYARLAKEYLDELGKMIISSPSPSGQGAGCLPYATQDDADTGHGWRTPKGKSTGSIAGTAYAILAYYDYNPLALD